ncbi:MAG: hypothetical protein E6H86_04485 [Chloroflexi bacterium]|nr:MAG: hypothetical protein E6H86_04485 [Chloroflexota bacterium]
MTALLLNAVAAHAFGPYTGGQVGYDVSYPQCPGTSAPPAPNGITWNFGIIGTNHGRPFTPPPAGCFANEYKAAASFTTPSVYMNSAYSGAYRRNITPACSSVSGESQAWQIGCSEADYSANQVGGRTVAVWWLDVETGNSWSTSNLTLNQQAIQGALDRLKAISPTWPVGVYSTTSMWTTITGGSFVPNGVAGDWVPVSTTDCTSTPPFMPGTNLWLTQKTINSVDVDTAC